MACVVRYGKEGSASKANDHAIAALKHLLTLASGTLVITLTFLGNLTENSCTIQLTWMVPTGWILLTISIWMAWVSMAEASKQINMQGSDKFVFRSGKLRVMARIAQWTFFFGLLALTLFSASNF